jgi:outer membrane protein assembly factor BamE (lipoprotein component of BamABCDE complex)
LPGSANMDRLLVQLDQVPIGASREKVIALLGPPDVNAETNVMFYLDPRTDTEDPSSRRVVGVYLDEKNSVSRLAVYGLRNGEVIDGLGHEILSAHAHEYPLLRFGLLDPKY